MEKELAGALLDPDFERLELAMREPNIFRALGIERHEIWHSNFFAYLLNPKENHGLGDIILRKFLRDVFGDERAKERTVFDADLLSLQDAGIQREWKNIDILIELPSDVVVIENKVDSTDHSNQLKRYQSLAIEEFPSKKKHFVYLTPTGSDPSIAEDRDVYVNYSYEQVAKIIENILSVYDSAITHRIKQYLTDYLTIVKQELLMNDKLNDLAVKLYRAHPKAFDFIFENRPDPASILYPFFEQELKARGFVIGSKNKGFVRFTTNSLDGRLPRSGSWWSEKEIFLFEIDYYWSGKNAIGKAIISPGDEELREKILRCVQGLKFYHKPEGRKWLVFFTKKVKFCASEVIAEEEAEIRKKVALVVDAVVGEAQEVFDTINRSIPAR